MSEDVKRMGRELAYQGTVLKVYKDHMKFSNGNTEDWDFIHHDGAAAVIPVMDDGKILMVKQYRNALERDTLEIPAGKLDEGEDPVTGALRELKEETGAVPDTLLPMGIILPAPGCYGERLHLFLARGLHMGEQQPDEDEFLRMERIPFSEMVHRVMNGEIEDAKTAVAVLKAKILLDL